MPPPKWLVKGRGFYNFFNRTSKCIPTELFNLVLFLVLLKCDIPNLSFLQLGNFCPSLYSFFKVKKENEVTGFEWFFTHK